MSEQQSAEYVQPPEGWFAFGTHVDCPVRLEFSDEVGDDLLPCWERPIPPRPADGRGAS